ncbi:MAG: hypothetical protein RR387_03475, partial [Clostridiales bacterium]
DTDFHTMPNRFAVYAKPPIANTASSIRIIYNSLSFVSVISLNILGFCKHPDQKDRIGSFFTKSPL